MTINRTRAITLFFSIMILVSGCAAPSTVGPPPVISPDKPKAVVSIPKKAVPGRKTRRIVALADEVRSLLIQSSDQAAELAVKRAGELIELLPNHPYPWVLLGLSGISTGDLVTAENGFTRALNLDPDDIIAMLGLGDVARITGKAPIAVKLYRKAYLSSGDPLAADRLAHLEISLGHYDNANTVLNSAYLKHPENDRVRNNLAVTLDLAGNRTEALELLNKKVLVGPELLRTRAMIHLKEGHPQTAAADLEGSFETDDTDRDGKMLLGILNLQRGELEAAEQNFREITSLYPDYPDGYLNLGFVLRRAGKFHEAARIYTEGTEVAESADLYLNLGVLKELYMGSPSEAVIHYRKFIQMRGAGSDRVNSWISYLESVADLAVAEGNKEK